jgi:hypothetical protein
MNKILLIVGVCLLLSAPFVIYEKVETKEKESLVFSGPVRPTDDEAYFRQTGITRPLEVKE